MPFLDAVAVDDAAIDFFSKTTMPASWAQAARLRNQERYGGYDALYKLFSVDPGRSVDDVARRIRAVVNAESTYRITGGRRGADGRMTVAVAGRLPAATVEHVACGTPSDAESWCREVSARQFDTDDDAPLWRPAVFELQSTDTLAVGVVCDHLICDGRSLWLFERDVRSSRPRSSRLGKPYLPWARHQAEEFNHQLDQHGRRCADFWSGNLAGRQADTASALDIALPNAAPFRGSAVTVSAPLLANMTTVRHEAAVCEVLPLAVVLAKVAAVAMRHATDDGVSLRFITHGRPPGYSRTHGFFADSLPFYAERDLLAADQRAIHAVAAFLEDASPYQDTPWDFIRTRCGGVATDVDEEPGDRQLVVNMVPYNVDQRPDGKVEPVVWHDGHIESLHVIVGLNEDGPGHVSATFNPDHFDIAGVQIFVAEICALLGPAS